METGILSVPSSPCDKLSSTVRLPVSIVRYRVQYLGLAAAQEIRGKPRGTIVFPKGPHPARPPRHTTPGRHARPQMIVTLTTCVFSYRLRPRSFIAFICLFVYLFNITAAKSFIKTQKLGAQKLNMFCSVVLQFICNANPIPVPILGRCPAASLPSW